MKRKSRTEDPDGTTWALGLGVGILVGGTITYGHFPLFLLIGFIVFIVIKTTSKKEAETEIDKVSLEECDRLALEIARKKPKKKHIEISYSDNENRIFSSPRTRIHKYTISKRDKKEKILLPGISRKK